MIMIIRGIDMLNKRVVTASCAALCFAIGVSSASAQTFEGPKDGKGLRINVLGEVDLGPEIDGMGGRKLRYRYWWIEPGGIIPVHSHKDRPAIIYMIKGEIVEHRSDTTTPKVHKAGETTLESQGVMHWWENKGSVGVELIVSDICKDKVSPMAGGC
jgi:quercetin dioxygenase-like cupin family protein